jgi:hypothetical protein
MRDPRNEREAYFALAATPRRATPHRAPATPSTLRRILRALFGV